MVIARGDVRGGIDTTPGATFSNLHEIEDQNSRFLLVFVHGYHNGGAGATLTTSGTFGGVDMTLLRESGTDVETSPLVFKSIHQSVYALHEPPLGLNSVFIGVGPTILTNLEWISIMSVDYSGVDRATVSAPLLTTLEGQVFSNPLTRNFTTTKPSMVMVDGIINKGDVSPVFNVGSGQNVLNNVLRNDGTAESAISEKFTALGSESTSWTNLDVTPGTGRGVVHAAVGLFPRRRRSNIS